MSSSPGSFETIKRSYRVDRREIAFLRFILEAYDGIAVLETLDSKFGIVVLHIAPGCEAEVDAILQDLKNDFMLESTITRKASGLDFPALGAGKDKSTSVL
jgi:hypothetical protein